MAEAPHLTHLLDVTAIVGPPVELGRSGQGRRRRVPIVGGTFQGRGELAAVSGRLVPGGADQQFIHADGLTEADAQYTLETADGHLIQVRNRGLRHAAPDVIARLLAGERVDPALVYFRTTPTFETTAPELQVLARSVFIGRGERYPSEVVLTFWKVD